MTIQDIPHITRLLRQLANRTHAPIQDLESARGANNPFKILVSTLLSARTRDQTTALVTARLFSRIQSHTDLAALSLSEIEQLIFPIGFYHTKARHLSQLPAVLDREFNGQVPDTIDELCRLPGVGRKTANLVLTAAFDKHAICVDIHVHRICNRLGLLQTHHPHATEQVLRRILPRRYWKEWNHLLVAFGQTLCLPVKPRCSSCPIADRCSRIGLTQHNATPPEQRQPRRQRKHTSQNQ